MTIELAIFDVDDVVVNMDEAASAAEAALRERLRAHLPPQLADAVADRLTDVLIRRDVPLGPDGLFLRLYPDIATGEVFEPDEPDCAPDSSLPE